MEREQTTIRLSADLMDRLKQEAERLKQIAVSACPG